MRTVPFLVAVSLFSSAALAAPRTFVSVLNGVDTNPCTRPAPCRSFSAALVVTDITGEVIALDSGGYGTMTISLAVSVIAPGGVYAGITAVSGDAVTINSTGAGAVILKNLVMNNVGGELGINVSNVRVLHVEGCTISGFSEGILFNAANSDARLYVKDSEVRRSAIGIYVLPSTAQATLESVRLYGNDSGVEVSSGEVTIRKSVAAGPGSYGIRAESTSKVTIEDTVASGNINGFYANAGATVFLTRCQAVGNNSAGIESLFSPTAVYVSDSTITRNGIGVYAFSGGIVLTRCTDVLVGAPPPPCPAGHFSNTLISNTTNGTFSGSYSSN
jgi:hypothetical protein